MMSEPATEKPTSLLRPLVEDLPGPPREAMLGGGEEKIAKQHQRGKLTARERIALLVDEGTFVELGIHGRPHFAQRAMDESRRPPTASSPAGATSTAACCIAAYDFTVMAGSMGMTGRAQGDAPARDRADRSGCPSSGCSTRPAPAIQEAAGSLFAGSGLLFREEVEMSGVVPMVAAMMGPCAAGTAYIPASPTSSRWSPARARWRWPDPTW